MAAGKERELQFGADAVGRRDQHGIAKPLKTKASAEASDIGENVFGEGAAGQAADRRDGAVCFLNIYSGILVTYAFFFRHVVDRWSQTSPSRLEFATPPGIAVVENRLTRFSASS
jgi:hypothetical protein